MGNGVIWRWRKELFNHLSKKNVWKILSHHRNSFYNPIVFGKGTVSLQKDSCSTPRKDNKNQEKGKEIMYIYKRFKFYILMYRTEEESGTKLTLVLYRPCQGQRVSSMITERVYYIYFVCLNLLWKISSIYKNTKKV